MKQRAVAVLARSLIALAGLIAIVALYASVRLLISAPSEFDLATLADAWPTLAALAVLIALALWRKPSTRPRNLIVPAAVAWLASGAAYVLLLPLGLSLGKISAAAIVSGVPVLAVALVLEATRRSPWATQLILSVCVALVAAWLTGPMWLLAVCGSTGLCA